MDASKFYVRPIYPGMCGYVCQTCQITIFTWGELSHSPSLKDLIRVAETHWTKDHFDIVPDLPKSPMIQNLLKNLDISCDRCGEPLCTGFCDISIKENANAS